MKDVWLAVRVTCPDSLAGETLAKELGYAIQAQEEIWAGQDDCTVADAQWGEPKVITDGLLLGVLD